MKNGDKKFQQELTKLELASVIDATDVVEALKTFYNIALAPSSYDEVKALKPWNYAIPEAQWKTIVNSFVVADTIGIVDTSQQDYPLHASLMFMNKGPSSF